MTVTDLLTDLKKKGIEVWAEGDRLRYSAPTGAVNDDLRAELRREKEHLLAWLRREGKGRADAPKAWTDDGVTAALMAPVRKAEQKISITGNPRLASGWMEELRVYPHRYGRYVAPYRSFLYAQLAMDKCFVRGEQCYLFDEHGNRYLDMVAQYGALPFGFNPPEIWHALQDARDRQEPSFVNPGMMDAAGELAERLVRIAPGKMRHVTFTNSGTEAVEVALKLARSAAGRHGILSTTNAFHGLTLGSMSVTGREAFQRGFGAPVPGFDRVPYGDTEALRSALAARPGYYAAFIVEPIQGEGGIVEPPTGYLSDVQRACREAGVLLIVDEVQTGLGRTGAIFACEDAGAAPDILLLAKALGGGLMPIGACLYTNEVYNTHFEMWHSSTFAGNTLACRAGLAALTLLEADNRALVKRVAENGDFLKRELENLRTRFPGLIREIRGRGYMLGLELGLNEDSLGSDLLVQMAEQQFLVHVLVGHLLNSERVRVAPAFTGAPVLRIEPPLIAGRDECSALVHALDRTLTLLQDGDAGALLGYMVAGDKVRPAVRRSSGRTSHRAQADPTAARFAFLIHLFSTRDYIELDESLACFSESQLAELHQRVRKFVEPFPIGTITVESPIGGRAVGELILIPHTAQELMRLPAEAALAETLRAAEIARSRDAEIVGLGGFTSVVTQGGLSLNGPGVSSLPRLTNGNSYTAVMVKRAVELACLERGADLEGATVAIVGAGGIIGRAAALSMLGNVARMILVGNPSLPDRSLARLLELACEAARHSQASARKGRGFHGRTLAAHLAELADHAGDGSDALKNVLRSNNRLLLTTDLDATLPQADVVISATNSVNTLIFERHLKQDAVVCDVSRPFNVCRKIRKTRPDVMLIDGGTVQIAGTADLRALRGANERHVPACVAETILLTFERAYDLPGLCGDLDLDTLAQLESFGRKHGFEVVLEGDEWGIGDLTNLSVS